MLISIWGGRSKVLSGATTGRSEQSVLNLLAVDVPSDLAAKAVSAGFTLTKIKNATREDLLRAFTKEEVELLRTNTQRRPIPDGVILRLVDEYHWRCCVCWDYDRIQPVVLHHIEEHARTQDDSYDNLVLLCPNHHASAHTKSDIAQPPLPAPLLRKLKEDWIEALEEMKAGKRPVPGREGRAAEISRAEEIGRIFTFRNERVQKITSGKTFLPLMPGPTTVIHLVPLASFAQPLRLDSENVFGGYGYPASFNDWGQHKRMNHDGILFHTTAPYILNHEVRPQPEHRYAQLFRNGIIEAVDSLGIWETNVKKLSGPRFEASLIRGFSGLPEALKVFNVPVPVILLVSFTGMEGCTIAGSDSQMHSEYLLRPIDRDVLLMDEVVLETLDQEPTVTLRSVFDRLWQAAGWMGSLSYDQAGRWHRQGR